MLGSLFASERRAIQASAWGEWPGDTGGTTWSGANVNTHSALQLLAVYGCNRFICDGIATLPTHTYRDDKGSAVEIPKARWLEEPVPDVDPIAWHTQNLTSLLLGGNSFQFLDYADGSLKTVRPLDPSKVTVNRARGRKVFSIGAEQFDSNRILHVPGVMFPGADVGMSPVEAARQTVGAGMAVTEFAGRFFGQGAVMSGVIEDPGPLDPDAAKMTAKIWGRLHSGKSKAHLPGVLQGGATWKQTGVTNEQSQFLQTQGFNASQIAALLFLIDPTEMGLASIAGSSLVYQNLEQRNARKVQVTFLPWVARLEKAYSSLLAKPRYYKFNTNALLRGDTKTRYDGYAVGLASKFLVPNEPRAWEDLPPLPDGDTVIEVPAPSEKKAVHRDEHGQIIGVDR